MDERKSAAVMLRIAAALGLLTGISQAALYAYARAHLAEILKKGSVQILGGFVTVTEDAALANPHLTAALFCFILAAGCFAGLRYLKKKP